jgi:hypothetical protein
MFHVRDRRIGMLVPGEELDCEDEREVIVSEGA